MLDVTIDKNIHGGYIINAAGNKQIFYGYSKANAIKIYRNMYNLNYKHFNIINLTED